MDTLLSAEKHSHASNQPVNAYRKLLVCDLLPLLAMENISVDLSSKLLFKLLHKTVEYYLCCLGLRNNMSQVKHIPKIKIIFIFLCYKLKIFELFFNYCLLFLQDVDGSRDQPWTKLYSVLEFTGKHLGWEPFLTNFGSNW